MIKWCPNGSKTVGVLQIPAQSPKKEVSGQMITQHAPNAEPTFGASVSLGRSDLLRSDRLGSLLPAASPVMVDIGRLHVNDKVMHFCAYLTLSLLPVIGFKDRRRAIVAGLSMFVLGVLLEGGQYFCPAAR